MTTRENNLLLQFMEMVYSKDLLRYFELTGFREETVLEKDRFGVESGELILSTEGQEWDAINEEKQSIAINFLQLGTPCEIVAKATGLSFEEVAQVLSNSLTASSVVSV